ncbi:hypothetical protein GCM10008107_09690 [Psychrosphaera saromensis]|uniref:Lipoprotein n=1 Tax=Psychrosphaera saromensis TaxID=716813 RepID=A0A2S7UUS7_9GAMM|nr:hypothetical protein [Psychrosphaera saromensis]PQJ53744.1 hypothetical protein BTO11_08760 [Psychrosphaera saromensis]GHB62655.1 hypothetical protein GCM10008107_09690 [Psychrosphaera saromensis]GLQ15472.1 hypothetical protein GCM10007917_29270 [Psychrosphaera saromensis]
MELKDLFKLSAVTLALTMTVACSDDDDKVEDVVVEDTVELTQIEIDQETLEAEYLAANGVAADIEILTGTLTADMTLTADKIYALRGPVVVGNDNEDNTVLTIDPSVTIFGETGGDYLVISRGSKIEANGTAADPITMTSKSDVLGETVAAGQWGGVVLLGNASSNKCTADAECALQVEGAFEGAVFGGTDDEDNSGTINYLVVKYAGFEIAPDNELNGVTFGGVGSGTEVDYLQVHSNADDGVEFFGGTVNLKHLVLTNNLDDSVDWDNGYRGSMQYVLVKHDATGEANRGIEADNDGSTPGKTPMSNPTIANMTIIGGSYKSDDKDSEGIYLREGTQGSFYNVVVTNAVGECLEVEGNSVSQGHLEDGGINFHSSVIACDENFKDGSYAKDDKGDVIGSPTHTLVDLTAWWTASTTNELNSTAADMSAVLNGIFTTDTTTPTTPADAFFDVTDFIGAVDADDDWTADWTVGLED